MLDTVRMQWAGIEFSDAFAEWLRQEYGQVSAQTAHYPNSDIVWQGVTVQDDVLGTIGVKSNRTGNYLTAERSLPKFMHGENCRVLSLGETVTALSLWTGAIESKFGPWFPPGVDMARLRKVQRVDVCHQRQFPCSSEVFPQIASTLNNKNMVRHQILLSPVQVYIGGVVMKQSMKEVVRFYDKGLESGNEAYHDVVRHEEQLRSGKAGYLLDMSGPVPVLNVEAAREQMNKRFEGWGASALVKSHDLSALLKEHGAIGGAALALVKCPELEPLFRRSYSASMFTRANKLARETSKSLTTVDLRVPVDAWREPMVL